MNKLRNLARVSTSTIGTGTITLGAAVPSFLTFAQAGALTGDVVTYGIADGLNSEVGQGTYTAAGTTLTRDVVYRSTGAANTGKITLSGTAEVYITMVAEDISALYSTNGLLLGDGAGNVTAASYESDVPITPAHIDLNFVNQIYWNAPNNPINPYSITRNTVAYMDDLAGNWTQFPANTLRVSNKGALFEEVRTNSIRNNSMQGAVAASPGTMPTNWNVGALGGLTQTVVGVGTELGVDYIDVRYNGTTSNSFFVIQFETTTGVVASNTQTWTLSEFVKLSGGSLTNITAVNLLQQELTSAGVFIKSDTGPAITPTGSLQRFQYTVALSGGATVGRLVPGIIFSYTNGTAVDFTIRIGWPQLELGAWATSPIRTTTVAGVRNADTSIALNLPPSFGTAISAAVSGTPNSPITNAANQYVLSIDDGTTNNRIQFLRQLTSGNAWAVCFGGAISNISVLLGVWAQGVSGNIAQADTSGSYAASFNGSGPSTTATAGSFPTGITTVHIGCAQNGAGSWNGYITRVLIWPTIRLGNQVVVDVSTTLPVTNGYAALPVSGITPGSVMFGGSTGLLAQDNTKFFWDDTNNFLGIGTTTPTIPLDVTAALGVTSAKFGASFPLYALSPTPSIGFNLYFNAAWKFGAASTAHYGGFISLQQSSGNLTFSVSSAAGAADATATMNTTMVITQTGLIALAGTTSAFPALKRSSTQLQVRLADDTADAPLSSSTMTVSGLTASRFVTSGTGGLLGVSATLANLVASISDVTSSTGTVNLVLSNNPVLVAPALGTPASGVLTNCTGLPAGSITGLGTGVATFLATPSSANLIAAVTDETGTGALVFATSPTLVTPLLGTPTSGVLTNCTGLPIGTGVSGLAAGVAAFLATPSSANLLAAMTDETGTGANVFATSPTLVTPLLGTPTSGVLTSCTGLPISTGVSGLATGVATFLGTPSSANLIAAVTDETGTGALVFATSPTLVTPALGTPASGNLANCTGYPAGSLGSLGTGIATFLATPSSANLITAVTDETGTGLLVFNTSPTLVTPLLGTPTSGVLTNCTGLPIGSITGLAAGIATFLGTPSSANLIAAVTDETGTGALVFGTTPTLATPVINGLPTGTGVASAATPSTLMTRDASGNAFASMMGKGYTTIVTAAGTTVLTIASNEQQFFTGTTTQIVTLPVTSTLTLGMTFFINNNSTGAVTVNSSGGNVVLVLAGNTSAIFTVILTSGTTAASWDALYRGSAITSGKILNINNSLTFTGTDGSTLNIGGGGTLGTNAYTSTAYAPLASPSFSGVVTIPTPFTLGAVSVTSTGTQLNYLNAATGTTGTTSTNIVFSASPTFTGTVTHPTPFTLGATSVTTTGTQLNYLNAATGTTGTTSTNVVFSTSPVLVTPNIGTPSAGVLTSCTGLPISTGVSGLATGIATFLGTPSSANLIAAVTDETGTGALVFATSPTLVTPLLGTPTSGVLTNCTGLPVGSVTGLGTGIATFLGTPSSANLIAAVTDETGTGLLVFNASPTFTGVITIPSPFTLGATSVTTTGTQLNYLNAATGTTGTTSTNVVFSASPTFTGTVTHPTPFTLGAISVTTTGTQLNYLNAATGTTGTTTTNIVFSTSPVLVTPNIGTPSAGVLTSCTGLPITTGVSGLGTGVATFLATPTSANLAAAVTNETGTGALVFGTAPTISGAIITSGIDQNPIAPVLVSTTTITNTASRGLVVVGKYLYVSENGTTQGFEIFDISNLAVPIKVGGLDLTAAALGEIAVAGQIAYIACNATATGVQIVDVSNPKTPVNLRSINTAVAVNGLTISGNLMAVSHNTGVLWKLYDISDPVNPVLKSNVSTTGSSGTRGCAFQGKYAYVTAAQAVAGTGGLSIIDISDPANATVVSTYNVAGATAASGVAVAGKYAFLTCAPAANGLEVVDISDPTAPVQVAVFATSNVASTTIFLNPIITGKYLYFPVGGATGGIQIIDISNPAVPANPGGVLTTFNAGAASQGIHIDGRYAFIGAGGNFKVVDLLGGSFASLSAGAAGIGDLHVDRRAYFADDIFAQRGLIVGQAGINSGGQLATGATRIVSNIGASDGAVLNVDAISNSTVAKFGPSLPLYTIAANPGLGFNARFTTQWLFGKGSAAGTNYAGAYGFITTTGEHFIQSSTATGAADAAATLQSVFGVNRNGLVTLGPAAAFTSSFPALKRSGTSLQVRLGDDSAFAPITASWLGLNGTTPTRPLEMTGTVTTSLNSAFDFPTTFASSVAGAQFFSAIYPTFAPTVATAWVMGTAVSALLSGSNNITEATTSYIEAPYLTSYSGTNPGLETLYIYSTIPGASATKYGGTYTGILITGTNNGNASTSGAVGNFGINIGSHTAAAAAGGSIFQRGMQITMPSGSGAGTTTNYGLYLTGNGGSGGTGTTTNWSLYSDSTAASYIGAILSIGGTGQLSASYNTTGATGSTLLLDDSQAIAVGAGGAIMFGNTRRFAAIKGFHQDSTGNGRGDIVFATRRGTADATLTETMRISYLGVTSFSADGGTSLVGANNQQTNDLMLTEVTTIAAAATTSTTIQIPARAMVIGVSVRATVAIPTAATYNVGVTGAATRYGTGIGTALANPFASPPIDNVFYYAAATPILITPNLTPATNVGRVRVTIHYIALNPPST